MKVAYSTSVWMIQDIDRTIASLKHNALAQQEFGRLLFIAIGEPGPVPPQIQMLTLSIDQLDTLHERIKYIARTVPRPRWNS